MAESVTKPYSVSIVYQEYQGTTTKTMLRAIHVNAVSEEEALGIGIKTIPDKDRLVRNAVMLTYAVKEFKIIEDEADDKEL